MGNISFYIPTVNKQDYNQEGIVKLLKEKFPDLNIEDEGSIEVNSDNESVIYFWFEEIPNYILDEIDESRKELIKRKCIDSEILKDILAFQAVFLDKDLKILQSKNECSFKTDLPRQKIIKFLHLHFGCFILDEEINPEMITPES